MVGEVLDNKSLTQLIGSMGVGHSEFTINNRFYSRSFTNDYIFN